MEDYNQKKSVLRNKHVQELRTLDKEIKKKKGVLKEQLESKRCDMVARHDQELDALAAECGVAMEPDAKLGETESDGTPSNPLKTGSSTAYYFADRDWQGLGKKELEMEAQKRGLGKKGNREELVTKLIIYHNEQKKKVDLGNIDPKNLAPSAKPRKRKGAPTPSSPGDNVDHVPDGLVTSNQFLKASVDNNSANPAFVDPKASFTKEKGENVSVSKGPKIEASGSSSSSSDTDSDSDSDSDASASKASSSDSQKKKKAADAASNEGDMDTPDSQRAMGSFKQDARGAQRRGLRRSHRGSRRGRRGPGGALRGASNAEDPEEEGGEANENAERQRKRERVMQQVLAKLTIKFPNGLSLDRLMPELANMKVANFHPSLLGYETIEDWICNQPANVVQLNRSQNIIYPPRSEELASDSSGDDSDNHD